MQFSISFFCIFCKHTNKTSDDTQSIQIGQHEYEISTTDNANTVYVAAEEQCDYFWNILTEINGNKSQQKRIMETFFDTDTNKNIPSGLYQFEQIFVAKINDQTIECDDNAKDSATKLLIRNDHDQWMSTKCWMSNSEKYGTDNQQENIYYFIVNFEIGYILNVEAKILMETKTKINRHNIDNPQSLKYAAVVQAKFLQDPY